MLRRQTAAQLDDFETQRSRQDQRKNDQDRRRHHDLEPRPRRLCSLLQSTNDRDEIRAHRIWGTLAPARAPVPYVTEKLHYTSYTVWVFPSDRKGRKTGELSHLSNPKEAWKRLLKRAGIKDLRIHDLRRTAGSYMAIQGVSPTIIGKALGHRSQAATAMYARLTQDPARQAMIKAQEALTQTKAKTIRRKGGSVASLNGKRSVTDGK